MKNKIFQSRDLCLRALDTNSACAKNVRRNEEKKNENEKITDKRIGSSHGCFSGSCLLYTSDTDAGFLAVSNLGSGRLIHQLFDDAGYSGDGDCIAHAFHLCAGKLCRVDTNNLTLHIDQCAAAVAGVDGRICLDVGRCLFCGNSAGNESIAVTGIRRGKGTVCLLYTSRCV